MMNSETFSGTDFLHRMEGKFQNGDVARAMEELMAGLWWGRKNTSASEWRQFVSEVAEIHPLRDILREDPFTDHAVRRPHGYPGDAELLDYIYYGEEHRPSNGTTARGREIFQVLYQDPACRAVRARMRITAEKIDQVAARSPGRILSVACGHVREARRSRAIVDGQVSRFVALDQDPVTLDRVQRELGPYGVTTEQEDIKNLILKDPDLGEYDFIYSLGLYDYLSDKAARRLTAKLFSHLVPGGTLLIANVLPDMYGSGYMEAFMDWELIYRTRGELLGLLDSIEPGSYTVQAYREPNGNILFLEIRTLKIPS
jgi:hypothetical protein